MKVFIAFFLIFLSLPAFAAKSWHGGKVISIDQHSDGNWVLRFDSDHPSCSNGNTPKYYYVIIGQEGVTEDSSSKMLSIALSSAMADKPLSIVFDTGTSSCSVGRVMVEF